MNYEILEEIGRGRRGIVYRGIDIINKREVAIKRVFSGVNVFKEIQNHLLLNKLEFDSIPILYEYFDDKNYTYIVQQLLRGDGFHNAWKVNENWDFIWMTIYHALKAIQQFHNYGYYHGDLHLNNLVWTGEKMYIIDFDKIGNYDKKLLELDEKEIEVAKYLPENWENQLDYDPFQEIDDEKRDLKNSFCDDYSYILSTAQFSRLGNYHEFTNINKGYERFIMLIKYSKSIDCESMNYETRIYQTHSDYIGHILMKYNEIDKLSPEIIESEL